MKTTRKLKINKTKHIRKHKAHMTNNNNTNNNRKEPDAQTQNETTRQQ